MNALTPEDSRCSVLLLVGGEQKNLHGQVCKLQIVDLESGKTRVQQNARAPFTCGGKKKETLIDALTVAVE